MIRIECDTGETVEVAAASLEGANLSGLNLHSAGQGADRGIIESVVSRSEFEALQRSGGISPTRTWSGFGTRQSLPENVLRSPEAVELFNRGIVR